MRRWRIVLLLAGLAAVGPGADKEIIYPPEFRPDMPFSPGVQVGDTLYSAGQTGADLKTNEYPESFAEEVHQTCKRVGIILEAANFDFSELVEAIVYLTDLFLFPRLTRTTVGVASLVGKARTAITVVARKR